MSPAASPNFLVIDIDSFRADRLTAERDGAPIAPTLARLAQQGHRFTHAFSQSAWTIPAAFSLLTGHLPQLVEIQADTLPRWDGGLRILPEILGIYGYRSVSYWGQTILAGDQFSRGFTDTVRGGEGYRVPLAAWIGGPGGAPFFAFVHNIDLHNPQPLLPFEALHRYTTDTPGCPGRSPPADFGALAPTLGRAAAGEHVLAHYDGAITYYDAVVADLLDQLSEAGVRDRTVVIVTSDHGEELLDRGEFRHGVHYDTVLRIPLIIADPAADPGSLDTRVVDTVVQTVDLAATVLARAGVPAEVTMDGRSLLPLLGLGGAPYEARDVYSLSNRVNASLRTPNLKVMLRSTWEQHLPGSAAVRQGGEVTEVYDLQADPEERADRGGSAPEAAALVARLDAWRADRVQVTAAVPREPVVERQRADLQRRGYWGLVDDGVPPPRDR